MAEEWLSILATSARSRGMAKMGAGTKQLMGAYRLRLWVPLTGSEHRRGQLNFKGILPLGILAGCLGKAWEADAMKVSSRPWGSVGH